MEAVILIGIPGSGKTTFYRERFFETHVRISLDMLRTRERENVLIAACLMAKQPFVVDNTNVLAVDRATYISRAKAAGFRVVGYFLKTDVRTAIARNKNRKDKKSIPVPGILRAYKRLAAPTLEEGFDVLEVVEKSTEAPETSATI